MVYLKRIDAKNVLEVCGLSDTLSEQHKKMVATNALSIAQAHCFENAWMRAIYLDDLPIGFIMTHIGSDFDDCFDVAGIYLWRFMIATPFQGKGYGKKAMNRLVSELKAKGCHSIDISVELGEGSPMEFYKKYGFVENGEYFGEEVGLTYTFK